MCARSQQEVAHVLNQPSWRRTLLSMKHRNTETQRSLLRFFLATFIGMNVEPTWFPLNDHISSVKKVQAKKLQCQLWIFFMKKKGWTTDLTMMELSTPSCRPDWSGAANSSSKKLDRHTLQPREKAGLTQDTQSAPSGRHNLNEHCTSIFSFDFNGKA